LITVAHPERRYFALQDQTTAVTWIRTSPIADLYVALGDPADAGGWTIRAYWKPLVSWIWGGALVMAFGGMVSLSDRRWRVRCRHEVAACSGANLGGGLIFSMRRLIYLVPVILFMALAGYFALALRPNYDSA